MSIPICGPAQPMPDGRGYDSIVIVAHSLGTLISADLLRFLFAEGDPELWPLGLATKRRGGKKSQNSQHGKIPIKLLTMGSPIRQTAEPVLSPSLRLGASNSRQWTETAPAAAWPESGRGILAFGNIFGTSLWRFRRIRKPLPAMWSHRS